MPSDTEAGRGRAAASANGTSRRDELLTVAAKLFAARTGVPIEAITDELTQARERGLLETAEGQLRPTLQGRRFLNELLQVFLRD